MQYDFEDMDDFVTDDDILSKKKTKKVDGKKKGNRTELTLTKVLNTRFGDGFSRSVGSGNRWGQVDHLPKHARDVFSGDLIVPKGFRFVIESKGGYDGIDMSSIFVRGNSELDGFLDQVTKDSKRCNRKPLLCWKKTRKPWLAFVHTKDLAGHNFKYKLQYGKWTAVALEHLLKLEDSFFLGSDDAGTSAGDDDQAS
jgi:hypothetical protein